MFQYKVINNVLRALKKKKKKKNLTPMPGKV